MRKETQKNAIEFREIPQENHVKERKIRQSKILKTSQYNQNNETNNTRNYCKSQIETSARELKKKMNEILKDQNKQLKKMIVSKIK